LGKGRKGEHKELTQIFVVQVPQGVQLKQQEEEITPYLEAKLDKGERHPPQGQDARRSLSLPIGFFAFGDMATHLKKMKWRCIPVDDLIV